MPIGKGGNMNFAPEVVHASRHGAVAPKRLCKLSSALPDFSMAFQPIVDVTSATVFGFEALVRSSAAHASSRSALGSRTRIGHCRFDYTCCARAIDCAARLGLGGSDRRLALNFPASAFAAADDCVHTVLHLAERAGIRRNQLIFEVTEREPIARQSREALRELTRNGAHIALDDFGAGVSGLATFADIRPSIVKLDRHLVHGVHADVSRMPILRAVIGMCREMGVTLIAEGVEAQRDFEILAGLGISMFQGYYFARPEFEAFPKVRWQ